MIVGACLGREDLAFLVRDPDGRYGLTETAKLAVTVRLAGFEASVRQRNDERFQALLDRAERAKTQKGRDRAYDLVDGRCYELHAEVLEEWGYPDYAAMAKGPSEFANRLMDQGWKEVVNL